MGIVRVRAVTTRMMIPIMSRGPGKEGCELTGKSYLLDVQEHLNVSFMWPDQALPDRENHTQRVLKQD